MLLTSRFWQWSINKEATKAAAYVNRVVALHRAWRTICPSRPFHRKRQKNRDLGAGV
jgi:hypothetical protein